jgi:hypothetical protein
MYKFIVLLLGLMLVAGLMVLPSAEPVEAQVGAGAVSSGFGAAFAYSQTIGWTSISSSGSIGNGSAWGYAVTPWSWSWTNVWTGGPSGAMAQSLGTPWGSTGATQVMSMPGGFAIGFAFAN